MHIHCILAYHIPYSREIPQTEIFTNFTPNFLEQPKLSRGNLEQHSGCPVGNLKNSLKLCPEHHLSHHYHPLTNNIHLTIITPSPTSISPLSPPHQHHLSHQYHPNHTIAPPSHTPLPQYLHITNISDTQHEKGTRDDVV